LKITELSALNFRNLAALEFEPGDRFNVISGDNGEGKSNLLEMIDYLGRLSSFRGGKTVDLIRNESDESEIRSMIESDIGRSEHRITLFRHRPKQVTIDGKRPRSNAAYFRAFQTVIFHPGSNLIASGPAEQRRAFIDRILEQLDPTYRATLADYERAVKSRNRLLKEAKAQLTAITAYDELIASSGAVIGRVRAELIAVLAPLAQRAFSEISREKAMLKVTYQPRVEPTVDAMREALKQSLKKDLDRGFTAEGPHADEIKLELKEVKIKNFASQGQHRAVVLALKVAELKEIEKRTGNVPVLLLDDVSSELDRGSNSRFFELLSALGGQVFLTTTHREFIVLESDRTDFEVRNGVVRKA
jgi:DNA replication and repair protein RecF